MVTKQPNPGWFRPGPDPRRHVLTREERVKGGLKAQRLYMSSGWLASWLRPRLAKGA